MRILADENVDAPIIAWLAGCGHDVLRMCESSPGASDEAVVTLAEREQRVIITSDRDFGELVFRHRARPAGVVYLRLGGLAPEEMLAKFQAAWAATESRVTGSFIVVTPGPIRVRPLNWAGS
jgi:predicted nuclease of predicted toxin-antitoxin system